MARDLVRRGGTVVAADDVQAQVGAGGFARRGEHPPLVEVEHVRIDRDRRVPVGEFVGVRQCVAAHRPSSRPASARTKAPVQIDMTRAPRS
ncbi:MAG TPA: hypothetical protein VGM60_03795 [Pseudonocardia sp.]